jgi:quinone-modifying oxidoreductase subunit QmoC
VNELRLTLGLYFRDGLMQGIRNAWSMRSVGLALLRSQRLNPSELLRGHRCKDGGGIRAMLAKAREIERRRMPG